METLISGTEYNQDLAFARQVERARLISYSTILGNQSLFRNKWRWLLSDHIVDVGSAQSPLRSRRICIIRPRRPWRPQQPQRPQRPQRPWQHQEVVSYTILDGRFRSKHLTSWCYGYKCAHCSNNELLDHQSLESFASLQLALTNGNNPLHKQGSAAELHLIVED